MRLLDLSRHQKGVQICSFAHFDDIEQLHTSKHFIYLQVPRHFDYSVIAFVALTSQAYATSI